MLDKYSCSQTSDFISTCRYRFTFLLIFITDYLIILDCPSYSLNLFSSYLPFSVLRLEDRTIPFFDARGLTNDWIQLTLRGGGTGAHFTSMQAAFSESFKICQTTAADNASVYAMYGRALRGVRSIRNTFLHCLPVDCPSSTLMMTSVFWMTH